MEDLSLEKSLYSRHFHTLKYMGAWVVDPSNTYKLNAYAFYKVVMTVLAFLGCFSLFLDFYYSLGDLKKITWNLCITTLFTAGLLKNIYTIHRSSTINGLRKNLHKQAMARQSPEDIALNESSARELILCQRFFYGFGGIFVPFWLVTLYLSHLWGHKRTPIPMTLPFNYDIDNELHYNAVFIALGLMGCIGIALVLETELAMFTILIQISREYKRLALDIKKINDLYEGPSMTGANKKEVNFNLRNIKAKQLIKHYCRYQQKLIKYTQDFELSYSFTMLLQVFALTVLVIVSAVQCILEFDGISLNIGYQLGYISALIMDMFLVCWYATRLRIQVSGTDMPTAAETQKDFIEKSLQCLSVGDHAYQVFWYEMDVDMQRDVCMIIMRSHRPPKITASKLMEMNLRAFMLMVRNIYSWLTLFQQLAFKPRE